MASRAFFRCRACGEPVVAGAYRCPVCAIDFPAGTPGAPAAPSSPAATDRARPARADERIPSSAASEAAGVAAPALAAHVIAARLDRALVEELSPPSPAAGGEPSERSRGRHEAPRGTREDGLDGVVPAVSDPDGPLGAGPHARLDAVPERVADAVPEASLSLAPGRERAPQKPAQPVARGAKAQVVRAWRPGELAPLRRRRNKSASLAVTIALGVAIIVAVGVGTYLIGSRQIMTVAGTAAPDAAALFTVRAADGWVDVPAQDGAVLITASGPYRVRIDGVVYHVSGEKSVRVPMADGTSLALRTAGEGTVAKVMPPRVGDPVASAAPR